MATRVSDGASVPVVQLDFAQLSDSNVDLTGEIEQAYGKDGLGILVVTGVEGFVEARQRLLPLANELASLPESELEKLQDPTSSYSFGWSHGKEILQNGKADTLKGSFYANPLMDQVKATDEERKTHYSYARDNLWPKETIPDLEPAFKSLGKLMISVGELVAKRCDEYILKATGNEEAAQCAKVIRESTCPKGRLLHYFPADQAPKDSDVDTWCGWHNDHGSLTGLTRAMFLDKDGNEVGNPDPEAGLYIRNRAGELVKVTIPEKAIAYQMGECLQILSGGMVNATPHYVRGASPKVEAAKGVSRNTLAIFMQPHWDDVLKVPEGMDAANVKKVEGWYNGDTFGKFTNIKLGGYYKDDAEVSAAQAS